MRRKTVRRSKKSPGSQAAPGVARRRPQPVSLHCVFNFLRGYTSMFVFPHRKSSMLWRLATTRQEVCTVMSPHPGVNFVSSREIF